MNHTVKVFQVKIYPASERVLHIIQHGVLLHAVVEARRHVPERRKGRGATWFANELHCDRTNVYNIFKREGIDTILLQRISAVLQRDFFALYCAAWEDRFGAEKYSTDS